MSDTVTAFPTWIVEQRELNRGDPRYRGRRYIIRKYALDCASQGIPASFDEYRSVLRFLDRGYSLKDDQISAELGVHYRSGKVQRQPRGRSVLIDGVEYRSARAASEAIEVSHQTVRRRVASNEPKWSEWRDVATA